MIHAAGIVGAAAMRAVTETTVATVTRSSHRRSTDRALAAALGERPLDFVLLMSSLSTVLGGLGFAAYAAANSFLDAFAAQQRRASAAAVAKRGLGRLGFPEEDMLGRTVQARAAGRPATAPVRGGRATFARVLALTAAAGDRLDRRPGRGSARWTVQNTPDALLGG